MDLVTLLIAILICIAIFAGIRLIARAAKITIDPDLMLIISVIVILIFLSIFFHVKL